MQQTDLADADGFQICFQVYIVASTLYFRVLFEIQHLVRWIKKKKNFGVVWTYDIRDVLVSVNFGCFSGIMCECYHPCFSDFVF